MASADPEKVCVGGQSYYLEDGPTRQIIVSNNEKLIHKYCAAIVWW